MAGVAYALVLYQTKSIAQCILAHAVTNFLLGIYVVQTGKWYFW
jgi:CAAX prenyl protease-like protein